MDRDLLHHPIIASLVIWCKEVLFKVMCFLWRAIQGRFPSDVALDSCGMPIHSIRCGLCGRSPKCADHVLVECSLVQSVQKLIGRWFGVNQAFFGNINDLLNCASNWESCCMKRKILMVFCYGMLWCLENLKQQSLK